MAQLQMNFVSDIFRSNILEFIQNGNELSSLYAFNSLMCFNYFLYNNSMQLSILIKAILI